MHPLKNRFRVMPPLTIGKSAIDRFVATLNLVLGDLSEEKLRPRGPRNPHSAATTGNRYSSRLEAAVRYAWTNSPKAIVNRLRARS